MCIWCNSTHHPSAVFTSSSLTFSSVEDDCCCVWSGARDTLENVLGCSQIYFFNTPLGWGCICFQINCEMPTLVYTHIVLMMRKDKLFQTFFLKLFFNLWKDREMTTRQMASFAGNLFPLSVSWTRHRLAAVGEREESSVQCPARDTRSRLKTARMPLHSSLSRWTIAFSFATPLLLDTGPPALCPAAPPAQQAAAPAEQPDALTLSAREARPRRGAFLTYSDKFIC